MVEWVEFVPKTFEDLPERFQYRRGGGGIRGEWRDDIPDNAWRCIFSGGGHNRCTFRKLVSTTQETEPMKIKMWRAMRVTPPNVPQTLTDCEEGRLTLVDTQQFGMIIRKRVGTSQLTSNNQTTHLDNGTLKFVRYLDDTQSTSRLVSDE